MPIYEFKCACGAVTERLLPMAERDGRGERCTSCDQATLDRLVSSSVSAHFKGPGFFCNDYPKHG